MGAGDLELPEQEMHTTSYWLTLPRELMDTLPYSPSVRLGGVRGLAEAMRQMAALFLMCDARDIRVTIEENHRLTPARIDSLDSQSGREIGAGLFEPNIFIYDNYPGGIGLSVPLYEMHDRVLRKQPASFAVALAKRAAPVVLALKGSAGALSKQVALEILERDSVILNEFPGKTATRGRS